MTIDDLDALAKRIVETMIREHPGVAAALTAHVLQEILAVDLFSGSDDDVTGFASAVNEKLGDMRSRSAPRGHGDWCVPIRRPGSDQPLLPLYIALNCLLSEAASRSASAG